MNDKPAYTLHGYFRSSASYRVRIALELKGVDYRSVPVRLRDAAHRSADFLALNPQGLVPVLEHGGAQLAQSLAIIEYLDDVEPWPVLLPADPADRARVRAMAQIVACEMHPLGNLRVLGYLREALGQDEAGVRAWYQHWMTAGFEALDPLLGRYGDGRHCFGASVTLADVCLVPQVFNARRFDCDLSAFGHVTAVADALSAHPAFAAAHPDRQPDAAP